MAKTQYESLGGMERAALARSIQTHGVVSVLIEIGSIVKSEATQKALAHAVAEINGTVKQRETQRKASPNQPVL